MVVFKSSTGHPKMKINRPIYKNRQFYRKICHRWPPSGHRSPAGPRTRDYIPDQRKKVTFKSQSLDSDHPIKKSVMKSSFIIKTDLKMIWKSGWKSNSRKFEYPEIGLFWTTFPTWAIFTFYGDVYSILTQIYPPTSGNKPNSAYFW